MGTGNKFTCRPLQNGLQLYSGGNALGTKDIFAMKWLDIRLDDTEWTQRNELMLIWGFNK